MNWDQLEGKWKQATGKVKEKCGKLTDSDLEVIRGRRDQFVGKIQERYGIAQEVAQKQAEEFVKALDLGDTDELLITDVTREDDSLEADTASRRLEKGQRAGHS